MESSSYLAFRRLWVLCQHHKKEGRRGREKGWEYRRKRGREKVKEGQREERGEEGKERRRGKERVTPRCERTGRYIFSDRWNTLSITQCPSNRTAFSVPTCLQHSEELQP